MKVVGMRGDQKPEASTGVENGKIFEKRFIKNDGDNFITKVKIDQSPKDSVGFELAVAGKLAI